MMRNILLVFFILGQFMLMGQENLTPVNGKRKSARVNSEEKILRAALQLPFFDDFSYDSNIPNFNLWETDTLVHLDAQLPFKAPSVGAAVLDAVSFGGYHYNDKPLQPFIADTLSSRPIDLSGCKKTPYLYFYYQPQGNGSIGSAPEKYDTLYLLVSGNGTKWDTVWREGGRTLEEFAKEKFDTTLLDFDSCYFSKVKILLDKQDYLTSDFRFKFVNRVSLGSTVAVESAEYVNDDFWLIDYVYLDTLSSGLPNDMAFSRRPLSILKDYETVPRSHFSEAVSSGRGRYSARIFNGTNQIKQWSTGVSFYSEDKSKRIDTVYYKETNVLPFSMYSEDISYNKDNLEKVIDYVNQTSGVFYVVNSMRSDQSGSGSGTYVDFLQNNRTWYRQEFSDYYAYDDGSAEAAYDMSYTDIRGTMVAMEFLTYKTDTLTAVRMNFQRNNPEDDGLGPFTLYIWNQKDGSVGDTLLVMQGVRPQYGKFLNDFAEITLPRGIVVSGKYYIGWLNVSGNRINVGFDRNRNNNDKVLFFAGNRWYKSEELGTLMIRPVFGSVPAEKTIMAPVGEWGVYPNPVTGNEFYLDGPLFDYNSGTVRLMNHMGRVVYEGNFNQRNIQAGDLQEGVYFIACFPENGLPDSKKIIISRQ